jgi:hypothetical protein
MVHPAQSIDVCKPLRKESNAVATIVESIDIISNADPTIVKTTPPVNGPILPAQKTVRCSDFMLDIHAASHISRLGIGIPSTYAS